MILSQTFVNVSKTPTFNTPLYTIKALECVNTFVQKPENNVYGASPTFIVLTGDPNTSYARTQCSSFFTRLLQITYPNQITDQTFTNLFGSKAPNSGKFYDAVISQNNFKRIFSIFDVQQGDMIFLKYPESNANSGHTMQIYSLQKRSVDTLPIVEGTEQWEIVVMDSSQSYHGKDDTRISPNNGIGRGTFRLYVSKADGTFQGYSWSIAASSTYYDKSSDRLLVIGRPTFLPVEDKERKFNNNEYVHDFWNENTHMDVIDLVKKDIKNEVSNLRSKDSSSKNEEFDYEKFWNASDD